MSAAEIIQQIEQLPDEERQRIFEYLHQVEDPDLGLELTPRAVADLEESRAQYARGEIVRWEDIQGRVQSLPE